jgi:hypothetical protein
VDREPIVAAKEKSTMSDNTYSVGDVPAVEGTPVAFGNGAFEGFGAAGGISPASEGEVLSTGGGYDGVAPWTTAAAEENAQELEEAEEAKEYSTTPDFEAMKAADMRGGEWQAQTAASLEASGYPAVPEEEEEGEEIEGVEEEVEGAGEGEGVNMGALGAEVDAPVRNNRRR